MSKNSLNRPVLVVDDEADIRDLMEMTLMKMGLSVETAEGVNAARKKLDQSKYSLVLTDMRMPDGSGLEVVEYINEKGLDVPVAVITAFGNADQAVQALKIGAFDYLHKPITLAQLRTLVKSAIKVQDEGSAKPETAAADTGSLKEREVQSEVPAAVEETVQPAKPRTVRSSKPTADAGGGSGDLPRLLGSSPQIEQVRQLIRKLAGANVPVYISGESGSGKEQAARSIHELSDRRDGPFIAVNCGAIPENLMESEFFGYKKGSFTGADQDRLGFFQHAHGGTLFLDEVADLPLAMQVKLLRAIQEKAVRRIGDAQEVQVDVRIVSATHKNLAALVESGQFRQDLFYRLNVVTLNMPALRDMREDLEGLIDRLLQRHHGSGVSISPAARKALLQYSYPGNFRELENILERAVALAAGNTIEVDDLQLNADPLLAKAEPAIGHSNGHSEDHAASEHQIIDGLPGFRLGSTQIQDYLDSIEQQILEYALKISQNNRTQAAKMLGISFRSMRYRLERLNIE